MYTWKIRKYIDTSNENSIYGLGKQENIETKRTRKFIYMKNKKKIFRCGKQ